MLVFFITHIQAQVNLVPNPSFEDTIHCPFMPGQIYYASHWSGPNGGTTDLFNSCASISSGVSIPYNIVGNQNPRTGNGYAGIYTWVNGVNLRDYVQTKIDSILIPSHKYCVKFYVSLQDTGNIACNNIGIYFSDTAIHSTNQLIFYVNPQITNNIITNPLTNKGSWTEVSGSFIANGGEQYMTIGNFIDDLNSDTVMLNTGIWQAPYYYIDDISVIDCTDEGIHEENGRRTDFKLYPNPNNGNMTLEYHIEENQTGVLNIYDVTGKQIISHNFNSTNSCITIDASTLDAGVYYYSIKEGDKKVKTDKLIIIK